LTKILKFFLFALMVGSMSATSQVTTDVKTPDQRPEPSAKETIIDPPMTGQASEPWEYGPFIESGKGMGDRADYYFLSAGAQLGKVLTPVVHAGILSGQFEFGGNIMPLWQAYTPSQHEVTVTCETNGNLYPCQQRYGGGTFRGVSLTPVILRWNFLTRSRRFQPWFQGAGGLIYTTHKFPPNILSSATLGIDGGTSVWNFSPQGGFGVHYFTRNKRSIDLGVNAVHISSASLGDRNPGVNALVQVEVGYTFWK
jgi:hypothetical protein